MPASAACSKVRIVECASTTRPASTAAKPAEGELESELVVLRDASSVAIRASRAEDEPVLRSCLEGLCLESRRLRFFTGAADLACAARIGVVTDASHYGLLAYDEMGVGRVLRGGSS
jgi:hypothetical protein